MTTTEPDVATRAATFREVFAVAEFRPLFGTFLLSTIGDELARVALTVLVYQRTDSPLLAAATFAISYLPWLLFGPLLATLADRFPRHRVLIASDAARAGLVALMAVPGTPLPLLLGLLFVVSLCAPPFESARSALMADVLDDDRYAVATSLSGISLQLAQVIGFVLAGALVALFDPGVALLLNSATFAVSALWLWVRLQDRPAPVAAAGEVTAGVWRDAGAGVRLILRTPALLTIIGVLWVATLFANASEGIATAVVEELGQGTAAVGVLLGAAPLGLTIGGLALARLVAPHRREVLVPWLVVLSLAPLVVAGLYAQAAGPGTSTYWVFVALHFLAGLGGAWLIPLNVAFVRAVPPAFRGRAFGVAVAGMYGVQGLGALGAGVVAESVDPTAVVALAGAAGLVVVAVPVLAYGRTRRHVAPAAGTARSSEA